ELYLRQKLERQRSLISQKQQLKSVVPATRSNSVLDEKHEARGSDQNEILNHLSPQELKVLQTENQNMVLEFESALDQVRETQKSIVEISTLQTQLANELDAQMQQTEQLYNQAVGALDAVDKGNDNLVSARKNQSSSRKWVLAIFIVLSL
ncbi:hypothetical protein GGI05_007811, partial [Coemansia sp. RSA 2603]